jgi:hypothetical protein
MNEEKWMQLSGYLMNYRLNLNIENYNHLNFFTSIRKFLERSKKHVSTPMFTLKTSLYPENKSLSNTNTFCGEIVTLRTPSLTSLHT